jgi:hypothetical protein
MALKAEALSMDSRERVLMKLGLSEYPTPTLDGLRALYAAWCRKVPFDNVRKLIHIHHHDPAPLPGDDATDFFEAWLTYGTGGTCWAGNGALYPFYPLKPRESYSLSGGRSVSSPLGAYPEQGQPVGW